MVWGGVSLGEDWVCVEFLTMWMLELSMGATKVEVIVCVMTVQNWLESAACWVVRLWPIEVGVLFFKWCMEVMAML